MKKLLVVICCSFTMFFVEAQNITSAEYYFDGNDNGFGNNTSLVITQSSESYNISIAGLSDGFHDMYIRVFDQAANNGTGAWSHYDKSTFYVKSFLTGQNILAARYSIDNGSTSNLTVSPSDSSINETYSIPIGALGEGFHSLYIEAQDSDGTWSHYDRSMFYVSTFPVGQNIIAARYFFNDDAPTNLSIDITGPNVSQSYSIPTTGLDEGFHSFYIETQIADLTWSLYDRQIIYVADFDNIPSDVISAEYFIDEDLGIGNNTSFSITSTTQMINFNTNGLSEGDHLFCIRVQNQDGSWSLYDCEIFTIDSNLGVVDSLYKSAAINPNPFSDNISFNFSKSVILKRIAVYDITGKKVFESNEDLRKIDLENLESGTYLLSLQTESEKTTFKVIKQ